MSGAAPPELEGVYLALRQLPERDLPALLKVYQGTPLYFDGLGDDARRLTVADVRDQWQAAQATPERFLLGVYHAETDLLIGAVDLQIGVPEPEGAAIWLLIWGGFQRQGYGQECMELIAGWLAELPDVSLLWAVAAANEEGLSFLRLQGFLPTDRAATPPIGRGSAHWMRR